MTSKLIPLILCSIFFLNAKDTLPKETVTSEAKDGTFIIHYKHIFNHSIEDCKKIINNKKHYPNWTLNGINELNTKNYYWVKGFDPKHEAKDQKDYFVFNYDVKFLFFNFKNIVKSELPPIKEKSDKKAIASVIPHIDSSFVKKATMHFILHKSGEESTFVHTRLSIKPTWVVYKLVPENIVRRVVASRLRRIMKNFDEQVLALKNKTPPK